MKLQFVGMMAGMMLVAASVVAAQTGAGSPPPIRMGLWQSEVSVNLSGMENLPPGAGADRTSVHQSCMTPDSWKKSMQAMRGQQPSRVNCTTANMQQDSHRIAFDEQCTAEQGYNTNVHVEMFLDSQEAMHGTAAVKMTGPAFQRPISMNSTITSKFLSKDCGDIKPGEERAVNPE